VLDTALGGDGMSDGNHAGIIKLPALLAWKTRSEHEAIAVEAFE
jgi:hypothetical protein